jgi:transposase
VFNPNPDHVIRHSVEDCPHCALNLSKESVFKAERRQVHDIPPFKLETTEHQIEWKRCPQCSALVSRTTVPADVCAPAQYGPRIKTLGV